jgi:antitoxin component YwqK of YwqJK toxin-antitoxin module
MTIIRLYLMLYQVNTKRSLLYTTNEVNDYHSYADLPALIELATGKCTWYKNGNIDRDPICGPVTATYNNCDETELVIDFMDRKLFTIRILYPDDDESECVLKVEYDNDILNCYFELSNVHGYHYSGTIIDGNRVGIWNYNDVKYYIDKDGYMNLLDTYTGKVEQYCPFSNDKRWEYDCINGKKEGIYCIFHNNGSIMARSEMKKDEFNGKRECWYNNGTIESIEYYENDELHGKCKYWDSGGNLIKECYYEEGQLNRLCTKWNEFGQVTSKEHYLEGIIDGLCERILHDGSRYICYYKNGLPHGNYMLYYPNGQMKIRKSYDNGKIMTETSYDTDGSIIANQVDDNKQNGYNLCAIL